MKKLLMLFLIMVLAVSSIKAFTSNEKKEFSGEWKFESSSAPEGYNKGVFSIRENEGSPTGEVKFADGYEVKMKDMAIKDGTLKFGIEIDYTYIPIKATVANNVLKGIATSPDGDIHFEAKRIKTEGQ